MDEQRFFGVLLTRPDHYAAYGRHVYRAFALPEPGDTINVEEVLTATVARARVIRILANPEYPIAAMLDESQGAEPSPGLVGGAS